MTSDLCLQLKEINYENYVLIWLEDFVRSDYRERLEKTFGLQLKIVQTFEQCEEYIRTLSIYDRIFLLFHSQRVQDVGSYGDLFKRISAIYLYGEYRQIDDQRFKYIEDLPDLPKTFEPFAFSLYKPSLNLDQSNSFLHFQILLDSLLHLTDNTIPNHTHLISLLRDIYPYENELFNQFERTYSSDRAVDWHHQQTCLSKILNKILWLVNINCLFLYRFFLHDLEQQFKLQQISSTIHCYQIQTLSNEKFDSIRHSIGDFLSINSFLSCKLNRQDIQIDENSSDGFQVVLFEIELNSHSERAYIQLSSTDIFIMCGSIFRILDVRVDDNQIWRIQLKSYRKTANDLKYAFDTIEDELDHNREQIDLITFGILLWKMKKFHDGEIYFQYLLEILPNDHINRANIYYNLGHIYRETNQMDLSLEYYQKSLEIWKNSSNSNEIDLANSYNAIATHFWKQNDSQQAYDLFHKALEIFRRIYGDHHLTVGMCWNNLATIVSNEDYYLKALHIFQEKLPLYHPNLASLHCNLSRIYKTRQQYDLALEHLHLALKIYEHSYPSTHSNICIILKNLGYLYEQKEDFQQALNCYQRIDRIYRQICTANDPLVQENEEKIRNLLTKLQKTE